MAKGNTTITDLLNLIFQQTALPGGWTGSLYLALHTADPGAGGSQTTSEATYGSYARVTVARTAGGWTIAGQSVSNTALLQFPTCTSGSNTITHVSAGLASSGAGQIVYSGALTTPLPVATTIQPQFAATALTVTEQ